MPTISSDFSAGSDGWTANFSDYNLGLADLNLSSGIRQLPEELGVQGRGFFLRGTNTADDLFMFITRPFGPAEGLEAGVSYELAITIEFASNAPSGAIGIGGAPGESVYLKAGGVTTQPFVEIDSNGELSISIDKGNQSTGGADVGVVDNIANGDSLVHPQPYKLLRKTYRHGTPICTNVHGQLWVVIGTDSGFEGQTALYYCGINVELRPVQPRH